jgi:uncharacterized membrane protein
MIGYRKVLVAIATLLVQVGCLWLGKDALIEPLTTGIITLIDVILAILVLLGILAPTTMGIAYLHYNVKQAKQLKK